MASKSTDKKIEKEAKEICLKTLSLLGFDLTPKITKEEGAIHIDIEGEDLGLLIGQHGSNLESLQLLIGIAINKKVSSGKWIPVLIDVGGWRKQREEAIKALVERAAEKVSMGDSKAELPPMSPAQRRVAHIFVSEQKGYVSESVGVGEDRRVVIRKENG
ncbi:MAG: hypothetical protein A2172_00865 [Candidatus Woykebacteria bacterium RBG_13_40_15]|uniref:R3H domain-containing protein n=1 Tax=Candidatus Woykebacteria bacterium RBG_13_40_15 TaxID=1802593 RepID=A0A1G1W955_9BACT|nr:MAG: hypothetical protein A2172_00865 [Candidatus Woykebacteria bacterium RBG_13_40_15]